MINNQLKCHNRKMNTRNLMLFNSNNSIKKMFHVYRGIKLLDEQTQ